MKKFIVTTTINSPTEATMKFLQKRDWEMVIVGDLKTPHEEYHKLQKQYSNLSYLDPEFQENYCKELSGAIGWNKIMRRNIGFCYAYAGEADLIATVDDDNIPYDNWGESLTVGKEVTAECWNSDNGVFDPLSVTSASYMWHRGYPAELIPTRSNIKYMGRVKRTPLIQVDLWDGVPDVDAISRIIYNPRIKLETPDLFCSDNIAPFNSQNTFIARDVIPYYMVLPYAGRMDDIWASYIVQKQFKDCVVFSKPSVYQERYEPHHRNMKDLKDETLGYEQSLNFINGDFPLPEESQKAYNIYKEFFKGLT